QQSRGQGLVPWHRQPAAMEARHDRRYLQGARHDEIGHDRQSDGGARQAQRQSDRRLVPARQPGHQPAAAVDSRPATATGGAIRRRNNAAGSIRNRPAATAAERLAAEPDDRAGAPAAKGLAPPPAAPAGAGPPPGPGPSPRQSAGADLAEPAGPTFGG